MSDMDLLIYTICKVTGRREIEIRRLLEAIKIDVDQQLPEQPEFLELESVLAEMQGLRNWFHHARLADLPSSVNVSDLLSLWNRRN